MIPVVHTAVTQVEHLVDADKAEELADEVAGARQADAGHREQHEEQRVMRHVDRQAAVAVDLARVQPVVDHADAEEQRARDEAVARA